VAPAAWADDGSVRSVPEIDFSDLDAVPDRCEAAAVLNISPRKADQVWAYARAWLLECLNVDPR
jgi:hypothetical protein